MDMRHAIDLIESISARQTILTGSLPDDLQTLIHQLVLDDPRALVTKVPEKLPLVYIDVTKIKRGTNVHLDDEHVSYDDNAAYNSDAASYDRGQLYAREMDLNQTPPVIVDGTAFLDGRHRLWQAQRIGLRVLAAIDLAGLMPPSSNASMLQIPADVIHATPDFASLDTNELREDVGNAPQLIASQTTCFMERRMRSAKTSWNLA